MQHVLPAQSFAAAPALRASARVAIAAHDGSSRPGSALVCADLLHRSVRRPSRRHTTRRRARARLTAAQQPRTAGATGLPARGGTADRRARLRPARAKLLENRSDRRADRPGAQGDHQIAGACQTTRPLPEVRQAFHELHAAGRGLLDGFREPLDRHARNRILAGRIDVGEHNLVGQRERGTELVRAARSACSGAAETRR